jgi:hypothetical protein
MHVSTPEKQKTKTKTKWKNKNKNIFWLVVSPENAQTTMEEPELGFQIG